MGARALGKHEKTIKRLGEALQGHTSLSPAALNAQVTAALMTARQLDGLDGGQWTAAAASVCQRQLSALIDSWREPVEDQTRAFLDSLRQPQPATAG